MNRAGHALQVFLLATMWASGCALAAKLDKDACAGLASELAALAATGIKSDMERGPEWARANLSADRLQTAQRVLEIEDQLEFRCSMRVNKPKDAPAAPVSVPPATIETRAHPPASGPPGAPPAALSAGMTAPGRPAASAAAASVPRTPPPMSLGARPTIQPPQAGPPPSPSTPPVATTKSLPTVAPAAAAVVEPGAANHVLAANPPPTAATAAPAVTAPSTPPVTKLGPLPSAAAAVAPAPAVVAPAPTPGPALTPGAKKPVDPAATAARKKNARRNSSSAYVAPGDVSPYSLPGMR